LLVFDLYGWFGGLIHGIRPESVGKNQNRKYDPKVYPKWMENIQTKQECFPGFNICFYRVTDRIYFIVLVVGSTDWYDKPRGDFSAFYCPTGICIF
jgi:hypothetical protein